MSKKIRKQAIELMKNELRTLFDEVKSNIKTGAGNKLIVEITNADKLNVLDRIKRDLLKFKAVGEANNGKKLSKTELKVALKEQRLTDEKERIKNLKQKQNPTFYVSGKFHVTTKYNWKNKKGQQFKEYPDTHVNATAIEAYTEKEAEGEFLKYGETHYVELGI